MLTLEKLKEVYIPINVYNKPNNLKDASRGIQLYNDSVNLYEALQFVAAAPAAGTDLAFTVDATNLYLTSSTGTDVTITPATTLAAGVMSASDKINANALITLSGVTATSLNLGTFTGTVIPDNVTIKAALQSLETNLASIPVITTGNLMSASTPITVTSGTGAVVGAGTTLTFNPALVLLSSLGGNLDLDQLSTTGASSGQFLIYDGAEWAATTYTPPVQDHNSLTGKQGGTASEYYHLDAEVYNAVYNLSGGELLGQASYLGAPQVQAITLDKSVVMNLTTGTITLVNDSTSPGNNKYYGTNGAGTKGFYDATAFTGVTEVQATDSASIDFTVTNPFTVPVITADLTDTGVTPSFYGSATQVGTFTVDVKGRISNAASVNISIPSTAITDFSEAVDDRVNALLVAGTGITLTYNDGANTLIIDGVAAGVSGTGLASRVAYWSNPTTITYDNDFTFDGTYATLGTTTPSSLARLTTKGLGNSLSTFGIVHQSLAGNEVLKVADNGAVTIGSLGEIYLHPDAINLATGGQFPITVSGGDMYLNSDTTVLVEGGGTASNTPSFKSIATRSTSVGNLYNAQITGTINQLLGGTNPFSDLYIDTIVNQTLHTGPIRSIYVNPTLTAANNYTGVEIDAPGQTALKTTAGDVSFTLGGDAEGDIYYRDASGNLARLGIGGAMEVLGSTGTVPAWTTTAGSLPGGANGDVLMYTGGTWVSATPVVEKQTGITGVGITLGATPAGSLLFILYRNGIYQDATDDYTILGNAITMVTALVASDKITAIYYT